MVVGVGGAADVLAAGGTFLAAALGVVPVGDGGGGADGDGPILVS